MKKKVWIGLFLGIAVMAGIIGCDITGTFQEGDNKTDISGSYESAALTSQTGIQEREDSGGQEREETGGQEREEPGAQEREEPGAQEREESGAQERKYLGVPDKKNIGELYSTVDTYQKLYQILEQQEKQKNVWINECEDEALDGAAVESTDTDTAGAGTADFSQTNIMTEGVEESDIVKNDGSYLYSVNPSGVKIYDIRKGKPKEVTEIRPKLSEPSSEIQEIYVDEDLLVVLLSQVKMSSGIPDSFQQNALEETVIYSYNIKDRSQPVLLGTAYQDGSYQTSRKIGNQIYLYTDYSLCCPAIEEEKAGEEEYLTYWIPSANGIPVAPECIYAPKLGTAYAWNGMLLTSIQIDRPETIVDAKLILYQEADIYVGTEGIYLYGYQENQGNGNSLGIAKLCYQKGRLTAGGSALLKGWINDSFAINEYQGQLRVLTTRYENTETNTLYLLDSDLKLQGRLDHIADGEEIYAARFMGTKAYFVTYRNTDPLFTADLSDPANPRIVSELSITGFSDYLHFWGKDRLLGIGYETDPVTGERLGIKLSMFRIDDPKQIYEENRLVIDTLDYSQAVSGNYKAILADEKKNLIGFAAEGSEWDDTSYYYVFSYEEQEGFSVELKNKFEQKIIEGNIREQYAGGYFYLTGQQEILCFIHEENGFSFCS